MESIEEESKEDPLQYSLTKPDWEKYKLEGQLTFNASVGSLTATFGGEP